MRHDTYIRESDTDSATYHCEVRTEPGGVSTRSNGAYTHQPPHDPPPTKGPHNNQQAEGKLLS